MIYTDMLNNVKKLEFNVKKSICIDDQGVELFIIRPSKASTGLRNEYDEQKNFQIWLSYNNIRTFRPNHLRILIDLNLRSRSRPDLKNKLLQAFDDIFYGTDPNEVIRSIENEKFNYTLNSLRIIANMSQLFLIEQEYNYTQESNFDPKTLFYQGWIREFIDNPKEIDNMCMSVARFQPPKAQYTYKENKKSKKYEPNLTPLWYIEKS